MNESIRTVHSSVPSPTSVSIDALEEIVRNCQRNEERLHELERHTRHERKKAERLLRDTSRTLQERRSQNGSIVESQPTNDNSLVDGPTSRSSREFFVALDDDETNENSPRSNHVKTHRQDQHLLERVEKLLAGDGTATSSEIMSSQERRKKLSSSPPVGDAEQRTRQLPSVCSIDYDLSTIDRLLSEQTPVQHHRVKANYSLDQSRKSIDADDKKDLSDKRDRQFYDRLTSYVHSGRFLSPDADKPKGTCNNDTYQCHARPITKIYKREDELSDLAHRCEDLLSRLHAQRQRAKQLEDASPHRDTYHPSPSTRSPPSSETKSHHRSASPPMSLQQSLELLRPDFISRSRQRARRIRLLREERERNAEIDRQRQQTLLFSCTTSCSNPSTRATSALSGRRSVSYTVPSDRSRLSATYREMKKATKKKYQQLPEVHDRRRQEQMEEIRRRNFVRAKLFRTRLRQHVARHGRTNIDESLTMIGT